jgi:sulfite reductase beta subunit-like hemoprotein
MHDLDDDRTEGQPPADLDNRYARMSDVEEFVARTQDYAEGLLTSDQYRAYRLTRGVYGQRQAEVFMLRIKMPGGLVLPDQLRTLAEVTEHAPDRLAHITTRENIQIHHFPLAEVGGWMAKLAEAGLTMREACGNAVRNMTQDPLAGMAPDDVFDTTPWLQAIVRHFLGLPRAQNLPRKFKIAFSSSPADRGYAAIHDIGLIATLTPEGEPAFKVLVAGGLASMPRSGLCVHEAWPARDILTPMLAVIDFFQEHGNRKVRSKARIKHVLRKLGDQAFLELYRGYLAKVQADPPPELDIPVDLHARKDVWHYARPTDAASVASGFAAWASTCVRETRLAGKVFVTLRLDRGGELTPQNLRDLATLTETYGAGVLYFTPQQNAMLRAVGVERLPELHRQLLAMGLAQPGAGTMADITSCPGVSTCNLGITFSRNLAEQLKEAVAARPDVDLPIKISGCHNSCGQHHIGTIGLYGALRRMGGRPSPHYKLLVGGHVDERGAVFGAEVGLVPAHRVVRAVERLLDHADGHRAAGETAGAYLRRAGADLLKPVVADLCDITDEQVSERDFWDIGADGPFRVEERDGECAA